MAYVKHPEHGNKHVPDDQVEALVAQGWVKWPRTKEQKAGFPFVPASTPAPVAEEPVERQKRKYTRKA
jgi:hypothetical protein